jgi:hypothetical protein
MISNIRKKALVQYVTPYKVIDMREIAKAFNLSIEQIEYEIAELIVSKKIQAKIDSHSKVSTKSSTLLIPILYQNLLTQYNLIPLDPHLYIILIPNPCS